MENAGVSLKSLQALARHSRVETTLKHYARVQIADVRSALDALPGLPQGNSSEVLRATGTDPANVSISASPVLAFCLAPQGRFQGAQVDSCGRTRESNAGNSLRENPVNYGVFAGKQQVELKEAPPGFEPGMADLQSAALPLGEGATRSSSGYVVGANAERSGRESALDRSFGRLCVFL